MKPPDNLKATYDALVGRDRNEFIDDAQDVAELTLHRLAPSGEKITQDRQPFTHVGAFAIRSLASTLMKVMMPFGIQWGKLNLKDEVWEKLRNGAADGSVEPQPPEVITAIQDKLNARSKQAIRSLNSKLSRSRGIRAVRRNLVEGNTGIVNTPQGMMVFPLRSIAVDRHFGDVRGFVFEEEILPDQSTEAGRAAESTKQWTYIRKRWKDPVSGKVSEPGVWRQAGEDGEVQQVKDESADQYFVFVSEIPEFEDYAHGYAYDFLRLIAQINHAERSLGQAMATASYSRPILRPGSSAAMQYAEFKAGKVNEPWVGDPDDFGWFNSSQKIGDWAFINQILQGWLSQVASIFALGIKDRSTGADTSATEILEIVDEINTQIGDLLTAFEETFQKPLFGSEIALLEIVSPLFADLGLEEGVMDLLEIEITTGTNVLSKQQALLRFVLQFLPQVVALDPQRTRINGGPVIDTFADSMPFPTNNLWSWQEQMPQPAAPEGAPPGGEQPQSGEMDRTETVMTPGGPQPPQPPQPQRI